MKDISKNNNSQIDNVKEFAKSVCDSNTFWNLLINKKVTRLNKEVKYTIIHNGGRQERGIKYLEFGKVSSIIHTQKSQILIIKIDYGNGFYIKYSREGFVEQFNIIFPPIPFQKIIALQQEEEARRN